MELSSLKEGLEVVFLVLQIYQLYDEIGTKKIFPSKEDLKTTTTTSTFVYHFHNDNSTLNLKHKGLG